MRYFMIKMRRNRLISLSLALLALDCSSGGTMEKLDIAPQSSFTGPVVVWSLGRKSTWVSVTVTTDSLIGQQLLLDSTGTLRSAPRTSLSLADVDSVLGAKAGSEWAGELLAAAAAGALLATSLYLLKLGECEKWKQEYHTSQPCYHS